MSHVFQEPGATIQPANRRAHLRQPVRSLAYVELGEGNGGIVLNVSEGGMAVQAVMSLMGDDLPLLRVQLAHSKKQIEAKGRVTWTGGLRKLAGVEFVDLSEEALTQIREWVSLEDPAQNSPAQDEEPIAKDDPAPALQAQPEAAKPIPEPTGFGTRRPPKRSPVFPTETSREVADALRRRRAPVMPAATVVGPTLVPEPLVPDAVVPVLQEPTEFPAPSVAVPTSRSDEPRRTTARPMGTAALDDSSASTVAPRTVAKEATPPVAAAPSVPLVAAPPRPAAAIPPDRFGFKPTARPWSIILKSILPEPRDKWKLAAWVTIFAVVSLAAGWIAGRGTLPGVFQKTDGTDSGEDAAAENEPGPEVSPSPNASEIEAVDVNNQRWLIPMRGSPNVPDVPHSEASAGSSPRPEDNRTTAEAISPPALSTRTQSVPSSNVEKATPTVASSSKPQNVPAAGSGGTPTRDGLLKAGELAHRVEPVYPAAAIANRLEGTVKIDADIDLDGSIKSLRALSGPQSLVPAALEAVRQWRYNPTTLDGKQISTERQITIVFQLAKSE
jgi:TonB family protein